MKLISSNGSAKVTLNPGEKIAISCEGTLANVSKATFPFGLTDFVKVAILKNEAYLSEAVIDKTVFNIDTIGVGETFYEVGVDPVLVCRYSDKISIGVIPPGEDVDLKTKGNLEIGGNLVVDEDVEFQSVGFETATGQTVNALTKVQTPLIEPPPLQALSLVNSSNQGLKLNSDGTVSNLNGTSESKRGFYSQFSLPQGAGWYRFAKFSAPGKGAGEFSIVGLFGAAYFNFHIKLSQSGGFPNISIWGNSENTSYCPQAIRVASDSVTSDYYLEIQGATDGELVLSKCAYTIENMEALAFTDGSTSVNLYTFPTLEISFSYTYALSNQDTSFSSFGTKAEGMRLTGKQNVLFGGALSAGVGAEKVTVLPLGTQGTGLTDGVATTASDLSAGNTTLNVQTEGTESLVEGVPSVSDRAVCLYWNGQKLYIPASLVAPS